MAEMSESQNNFISNANITPNRLTLRHQQPNLILRKNCAFERCLWEEDARVAFISPALRQASLMHLLSVTTTARFLLLENATESQKFFVFSLAELVDGVDKSVKLLAFEEAGISFFEAFSQQQYHGLVKALSTQLYAIPSNEAFNVNPFKFNPVVSTLLLRVIFLGLMRQTRDVEHLLHKLKSVIYMALNQASNENRLGAGTALTLSYSRLLRSMYLEGNGLVLSRNRLALRFVMSRLKPQKTTVSLKQYLWKRGVFSMERNSVYSRIQHGYFYSGHRLSTRESSLSFLYVLRRIEDKYRVLLQQDAVIAQRLLNARNYLLILAEERLHRQRQNTLLLGRPNTIRVIRRRLWRNLLVEALLRSAEHSKEGRSKLQDILPTLMQVLSRNVNVLTPQKEHKHVLNSNASSLMGKPNNNQIEMFVPERLNWRRPLRLRRLPFVNKKIVEEESAYPFKGYIDLMSQLTGREVSVFFINALSLTRFAFQGEGKGKSSQRFLQNIDREMVSRYKYVAVYIQDFVRVSFISLFLKKPTFLAQFMALQISKLPRNRKETKMLRFLIKVVKIFAAQRREVVGLRILFKGRVNRWRRTKQVVGEKGILPLQSINTRIEFGSSKAITRKGTLGIRLWICYNPVFRRELHKAFVDYVEYSQHLRQQALDRFLSRMQSRIFFENK